MFKYTAVISNIANNPHDTFVANVEVQKEKDFESIMTEALYEVWLAFGTEFVTEQGYMSFQDFRENVPYDMNGIFEGHIKQVF